MKKSTIIQIVIIIVLVVALGILVKFAIDANTSNEGNNAGQMTPPDGQMRKWRRFF